MTRFKSGALCLSALVSSGVLSACDPSDGEALGTIPLEGLPGGESADMRGFSWVISNQVAGMPRPGSSRALEKDLLFLREQGVDVLVSLTETPTDPAALNKYGIEALHIPVRDFQPPTQAQLDQYVNAMAGWLATGRSIGTHCGAGMGRTGTFLAALFVARGMEADAAIEEIRRLRPGSIETAAQEQAVRDFAARHN